ncbi:ABC1 family protein [Smittium culicis]|uniref:ABC1 family protein n=1 Tax=Smittium culicis TaxID=133412 RepID=A0A1R1YAC0_9FUNG|nr:ABC1 family protein [Smittium culicis]
MILFGTRVQSKDNELSGAIWWYKLVCRQMSLAGPTFVKLSQWASTRTDIFPPQFCIEISKLQSDNKPHSFRFTKSVLESNLPGGNITQIFEWIDPVPMGVGSIAQVHKAKLNKHTIDLVIAYAENIIRQNGIEKIPTVSELASIKHKYPQINSTQNKAVNKILLENISLVNFLRSEKNEVAVKILHPRVDKLINRDLRIMSFFAHLISLLPTLKWLSLPEEVATFGEMMRTQLDLRIEGQNFLQFSNNFNFRENGKNILRGSEISFPIPIPILSSKKFLVEKFCDGVSIDLFLKNIPSSFDKEISRLGLDSFMRMMILDNFIHSDLHPGNILVSFKPPESLPKPLGIIAEIRNIKRKIFGYFSSKDSYSSHETDLKSDIKNIGTKNCYDDICDTEDEVSSNLRNLSMEKNPDLLRQYLKQIYDAGYKPNLTFLDCGLIVELDARSRRNFLDLFEAISRFDGRRAGELIADRCPHPEEVLNKDEFVEKLSEQVDEIKKNSLKLGTVSATSILLRTMNNARCHHVRLDHSFVNLAVAIFVLEGIGRQLDNDLDLLKASLPILRQLFRSEAQAGITNLMKSSDKQQPNATSTSDNGQANSIKIGGVDSQESTKESGLELQTQFDLLKLWAYIEVREYFNSVISNWGMDDYEFFGEFTPFVSYID